MIRQISFEESWSAGDLV